MARILGSILLLAVIGYGIWPYYTVFRLDSALAQPEPAALAPYVDLPAIQQRYKGRIGSTVDGFVPRGGSDGDRVIGWLAENLTRIGDAALDQAITLEWVRNTLREAIGQATRGRPANLVSAIDFAFFESWNRFVIRIGELGAATHVVMTLEGGAWRITDVVR